MILFEYFWRFYQDLRWFAALDHKIVFEAILAKFCISLQDIAKKATCTYLQIMSSPTTTEVTNVVEMAYAWEFKRPPGGPNAKHLTLLYLSRSINDNITAVPAPRLWPVTTRGKSGYSTYALSKRCFSRICKTTTTKKDRAQFHSGLKCWWLFRVM